MYNKYSNIDVFVVFSERGQMMNIHDYITLGDKNLINEYISTRPMENCKGDGSMPFEKVDPIAEAMELQEMFKDDPETKEMFRQYELEHRETARIQREELEIRTGMSQQAISRFEKGNGVNFKTILKCAEGIECKLVPQSK